MATRIIPKTTARWLPNQWHLRVTVIHPHQSWMKATLLLRVGPHRRIRPMELAKQTRMKRQQTKPKTGMKNLIMKMPYPRAKTNLRAVTLNRNPNSDIYPLKMISLIKHPSKLVMTIVPRLIQLQRPLPRIRQTLSSRKRKQPTAARVVTKRKLVCRAESSLRMKLPTLTRIKACLTGEIRRPHRVHPHLSPLLHKSSQTPQQMKSLSLRHQLIRQLVTTQIQSKISPIAT